MAVQVIETPQALPAQCVYCGGSVHKKWFLDTDLNFEYYGALIFCNECFYSMAATAGYINPEIAHDLKEKCKRLEHENDELKLKLVAMEQAVNALKVAGFTDGNSSSTPEFESDDSVRAVLLSVENLTEPASNRQGRLVTEGDRPVESSDDERVADLQPVGESDNPFDL